MKRNCLGLAFTALMIGLANQLQAQILVNPAPAGSGIQTFDIAPPVGSWSTATNAGGFSDVATAAALDPW